MKHSTKKCIFMAVALLATGTLSGCSNSSIAPEITSCPDSLIGELKVASEDAKQAFEESPALSGVAQELVGLPEQVGQNCVERAGLTWRVVEKDKESFPVTLDYSPTRINASILEGKVAAISLG